MAKRKIGLIVGALVACLVAVLLVKLVQNQATGREEDKKRVLLLWATLREVGEISDPENRGLDPELASAVQAMSEALKARQPDVWEKQVKGAENNLSLFLDRVELAIKSQHRPIFDLVRLREGSERVLAGAKVSESWPVLPSQLAGFAHRQVAERSGDASLAVLPYALIGKWSFQKEGKVSDKSFPALDLSDPKVRALVADVAKAENSASLAAVARESGGLLVPSFGARSHYEGCFKQEEGRVELNAEIERCRNLGIKYMVTAKHAAATSAAITGSCKVEKIRLFGTTTDIDPCFPEYE